MRLCALGGIEKFRFGFWFHANRGAVGALAALSTNATGQLNVLGHDRHTLGVNGTQVRVFKETNEVSFRSFLQGKDGRSLETQITLEVLRNLTHQTLERQLADEQIGGLLVATDLTQSHSSGAVAMRLLHAPGSGGTLASRLRGELLARSLASSGFASGLLGTGHVDYWMIDFCLLIRVELKAEELFS